MSVIKVRKYGNSVYVIYSHGNKKFKVFIYTHELKWISGYAYISSQNSNTLILDMDEPVKKGTSGSGVYNEKGEIVGIFKKASIDSDLGMATLPRLALPVWIARQI